MRFLYSAVLYFLTPLVILRLLILSIRNPDYRKRWTERFGFTSLPSSENKILWIHAVSVGEVQASKPLVHQLQKQYPQLQIMVTTMTPTGAKTVQQQFGDTVIHKYIPYDLPVSVKRFLLLVKPVMLIVMETEIWPNLYYQCNRKNIPVIIANARLSRKSFTGYHALGRFTAVTLSYVSHVLAQGQVDADRFEMLGVAKSRIIITGNLKFDIRFPGSIREQAQVIRRYLSVNRPVWISASTHEGEEKILLNAFQKVIKNHPDCLMIIAPRHPERFEMVTNLSIKHGFNTLRKSQHQPISSDTKVFILDTLGELPVFYAASDIAFVGGSLVNHGGHNMLEPASLGVPVITGPYISNFEEITDMLVASGAAWVIHDPEQLVDRINLLLIDANLRYSAGENGKKLVESNRGNVIKLLEILNHYLVNYVESDVK